MTPRLRQTHQTIWLLLAVALPIGFGAALFQREQPLTQEPISQSLPAPLPVQLRSVGARAMVLTLRQTADSSAMQLDISVKTALEFPSAVVRVQYRNGWRAVGLVNAPGLYRFAMPGADSHPKIEVVDDIHQHTLYTFQL
jgi:hypothetical protein